MMNTPKTGTYYYYHYYYHYYVVVLTIHYLREGERRGDAGVPPVDTAAALASGSTTWTPLPQPRVRALPLLLCSGHCAPSKPPASPRMKGRPEDLRLKPLTGI